ncbi:hypothetical protein EV214_12546 [Marinisporobacter balticus]|uniref:Uncharacterized protein n=1 Tax=Marinisporobacter balticus TaxID=2018667 RepID=A0A4R2KJC2_9FIRM|nr:hypothetical protein EV214_12546 [Marinisporobacter balticus]
MKDKQSDQVKRYHSIKFKLIIAIVIVQFLSSTSRKYYQLPHSTIKGNINLCFVLAHSK